MVIKYIDEIHFYDGIKELVMRGLMFSANREKLIIELNITIGDIFKMDIKEISIDQDSFETEVKRFLIKELQEELNDWTIRKRTISQRNRFI